MLPPPDTFKWNKTKVDILLVNPGEDDTVKEKTICLDGLKKFIDDRDALDAEIPADDGEEEKSDEKELKKGLSKRELSIMRLLNK